MISPINIKDLENPLFTIKGTDNKYSSLSFIDFKNTSASNISVQNNYSHSNVIAPSVYTKNIQLKPQIFQNYQFINSEIILDKLKEDFVKNLVILGNKHRELSDMKIEFDITLKDIKGSKQNHSHKIQNKLNLLKGVIGFKGRIGPANFLISNHRVFRYLCEQADSMSFSSKDKDLYTIDNTNYIVDQNIPDDIMIAGRKNNINQPGIHCLILTDKNGFINIDRHEITYPGSYSFHAESRSNYAIQYAIVDVGSEPELQYYTINTIDISYSRYKKLKNIQEIYGK
jgi:hypothetical protein